MQITFDPNHVLDVFTATYAIVVSGGDPEVNKGLEITPDLPLTEWIDGMDLVADWRVNLAAYNKSFSADIAADQFRCLWGSNTATLADLATLISQSSIPKRIPCWKFGGRVCGAGSILRFLLREVNMELPEQVRISSRTSINRLAQGSNWFLFGTITALFPGEIPPPVRINHRSLLPRHIRLLTSGFQIVASTLVLGFIAAVIGHSMIASIIAGSGLFAVVMAFIAYRRIVKVPRTTHTIFPGLTNLRDMSLKIAASRGGTSSN